MVQSIGFIGPGVSLLCLRFAQTPSVAAVLMTIALSLSSFSQAGYFCNVQVVILFPACLDHTISTPITFFVSGVLLPLYPYSDLTECVFLDFSSRTLLLNTLDLCTVCSQTWALIDKIHISVTHSSALVSDISSAAWTGLTNGIGTVAAIVSTIGTGYFVQWLGSFQAFLTLTAVLYFSATVFYNAYATGDQIFYWVEKIIFCVKFRVLAQLLSLRAPRAEPRIE